MISHSELAKDRCCNGDLLPPSGGFRRLPAVRRKKKTIIWMPFRLNYASSFSLYLDSISDSPAASIVQSLPIEQTLVFVQSQSQSQSQTLVLERDRKLAAVGVKVSRWITYHGIALNVTTDLTPFDWIGPCGIKNRKVGSIKSLLAGLDDSQLIETAYQSLIREFSEFF